MRVIVKKLYLDKYVSVRDYLVEECRHKGEDLLVFHDGKTMKIRWQDLSKGKRDQKQQFSKFDKKAYHLIDFIWKPSKEVPKNENQVELF